jgi:hypothetical protein
VLPVGLPLTATVYRGRASRPVTGASRMRGSSRTISTCMPHLASARSAGQAPAAVGWLKGTAGGWHDPSAACLAHQPDVWRQGAGDPNVGWFRPETGRRGPRPPVPRRVPDRYNRSSPCRRPTTVAPNAWWPR